MPAADGGRRYLCCNGDESEPGTFKDRQLMEYNPHLVFEGMLIACYAMSIDTAYLYVRGEYADWITHMERELAQSLSEGLRRQEYSGLGFLCRYRHPQGCGRLHLRRRNQPDGVARGQARLPAQQASLSGPVRSVWAAHDDQQCGDAGLRTPHHRPRSDVVAGSIGSEKHPGPVLYGISGHVNRPGVYEYPVRHADFRSHLRGGGRDAQRQEGEGRHSGWKFDAAPPGRHDRRASRWTSSRSARQDQ